MLGARTTNMRARFKCPPAIRCLADVYHLRGAVLPLQGDFAAVPLAFAMRPLVFVLSGLFASAGLIQGEIKTPENGPIEITSTGQTTYENGMATARDNVAIHIGNTDIYADYAQYNSSTHDVTLRGHEIGRASCREREEISGV